MIKFFPKRKIPLKTSAFYLLADDPEPAERIIFHNKYSCITNAVVFLVPAQFTFLF